MSRVRAWRIVKAKHAGDAFSGEGARLAGGRFNSPGRPAVYMAGSPSLAMLEMLVHLESQELLRRYVIYEITLDTAWVTTVAPDDLPGTWRDSPPPPAVQHVGDRWLEQGQSAALRVPSAVVPTEWNYLLNPLHADFVRTTIGAKQPIEFDPRLLKR